MAPTARTRSLRLVEPEPEGGLDESVTFDVDLGEIAPGVSIKDGALLVENQDGSATVDFNPDLSDPDKGGSKDFYGNLANKLDEGKLAEIASDLLDGIQRDEQSRTEWLATRATGIKLLGLKLDEPRGDIGAGAPLEGMSTVRHPLLLESTVAFQATAGGELLPASGPVKVRNDTPPPPKIIPPPQLPGQPALPLPPPPESGNEIEELASALEKDMNHYLTTVATEYYPDTDRMLFYIGFGGDGFKKVYNCPLRRRPVSESVDAEDLVVSNASTDIKNCVRVTHKIKMRRSVLRRMQILGAYRDVDIGTPSPPPPNAVEQEKMEIAGQRVTAQQPKDRDYEIYECYCELDIPEFAPKQFKGEGLPLPYRVTIEKESRQVLSVIRNWHEQDEQCLQKQFFVQFPFIRGLGFYGLGFIHLVGNTTSALTACWREMLDNGMFANFPGFLYAKGAGRQLSNQFRVPPGGGVGLDIGTNDIRQAVMALPYKETGPSFTSFVEKVENKGSQLAATAQINVGEGKQDAPVGTTLALIEQATKLISSVHKRLHAAQAEEFMLLKERFREDPEAFWRHNKKPTVPWKKEQFLKALELNDLVPVADPNNPTSLHRIAKATTIKTLQQASPRLYDGKAVDERICRIVGIDPEGLFLPTPAPEPPDPRMEAIKQKSESLKMQTQYQMQDSMTKAQLQLKQLEEKSLDRESREKIAAMKLLLEEMELAQAKLIHGDESRREDQRAALEDLTERMRATREAQIEMLNQAREAEYEDRTRAREEEHEYRRQQHESAVENERQRSELERDRERYYHDAQRSDEQHRQKMEHTEEMHKAKLEQAKALAAQARKAKPAKKSGDK